MKKITLLTLVLLTVLVLGGCSWMDGWQDWKNGEDDGEATNATPEAQVEDPLDSASQPPVTPVNPNQDQAQAGAQTTESPLSSETREVVLYFADASGNKLEKETRQIPKVEGMARAVVNELINGPQDDNLLPTIPSATTLEDINIKEDGTCIVDFSEELMTHHPGGLLNEELTVYSIVNTLSQFPTVSQVKILVDGQVQDTIAGHMDIRETLARNDDLVEE